jgi:hypothetical protein
LDEPSDSTIELATVVDFKRRGVETKLVLPGLAQQNQGVRGNPALIKSIARGRAWFEELASGRARSLQESAKRDGITRRYIRLLVGDRGSDAMTVTARQQNGFSAKLSGRPVKPG